MVSFLYWERIAEALSSWGFRKVNFQHADYIFEAENSHLTTKPQLPMSPFVRPT